MKKILVFITIVAILGVTGCGNKDLIDTNYTYNRAIIALPNGEVADVQIEQWRDYEDGEQIQIIAEDGTIYLTSSINCTLIKEK